MHLKFSIQSI